MKKTEIEVVMTTEETNIIRLYANTVYDMLVPEPYHGDIFTKREELLQHHPDCEVMVGYGLAEPITGILFPQSDDWYGTIEEALIGIQELKHGEEVTDLYDMMTGYYDSYKPDDSFFLEENEDVAEQIQELDNLYPMTFKERVEGLGQLADFVSDWFPDSIEEDEQTEIRATLVQASQVYTELRNAFQEAKKLAKTF